MNFFKNISIGKEITFTFGFLFLIVLVVGISWQRGIDSLKKIEGGKNNLIELKERLREMQLIHHHWVDSLRESVRNREAFEGEIDPEKCVFGQWYYSYRLPYPELKNLFEAFEKPHRNLHIGGENVRKAAEQGDIAEAEKAVSACKADSAS